MINPKEAPPGCVAVSSKDRCVGCKFHTDTDCMDESDISCLPSDRTDRTRAIFVDDPEQQKEPGLDYEQLYKDAFMAAENDVADAMIALKYEHQKKMEQIKRSIIQLAVAVQVQAYALDHNRQKTSSSNECKRYRQRPNLPVLPLLGNRRLFRGNGRPESAIELVFRMR
jgi:hypothetical protein